MEEKKEFCPQCENNGHKEELLLIPPREGRKQCWHCAQGHGDFSRDKNGNMVRQGIDHLF